MPYVVRVKGKRAKEKVDACVNELDVNGQETKSTESEKNYFTTVTDET